MKGTILTGILNFVMWFGVFSTTLFLPGDNPAMNYSGAIDSMLLDEHYRGVIMREKVEALNTQIEVSGCQLYQLEVSLEMSKLITGPKVGTTAQDSILTSTDSITKH